ncbi:STAS domain-containing protein [Umezawaea endophytica]|uniref:STAS domain-containing protein n=1 Tax=Umezawaea endophytica TaxID=1654476 RepID=A0A9X2VQV6_9PSEU|nr:STAS domain-containing protein [Umezawaea endophytica]MCS7481206.1 STAS domain-containing protein [Umezawaea endophytica]
MPTDVRGVLTVERWRLAGATVVAARGDLDLGSVRRLRWSVDSVAPGSGPLVLDLSGVACFGSVGVAALLETARRARAFRIDFRLVCPDPVASVLDEVGVLDEFTVFDSRAAALAQSE